MALFSQKKDKKEETAVIAKDQVTTKNTNQVLGHNLSTVIKGLRLTEKSVNQGERNVYTFNVNRTATKYEIRDAIKAIYNVTPVKVNIVNKKPTTRTTGAKTRAMKVAGLKKAYVYLKKGDTINLV